MKLCSTSPHSSANEPQNYFIVQKANILTKISKPKINIFQLKIFFNSFKNKFSDTFVLRRVVKG